MISHRHSKISGNKTSVVSTFWSRALRCAWEVAQEWLHWIQPLDVLRIYSLQSVCAVDSRYLQWMCTVWDWRGAGLGAGLSPPAICCISFLQPALSGPLVQSTHTQSVWACCCIPAIGREQSYYTGIILISRQYWHGQTLSSNFDWLYLLLCLPNTNM